MSIKKWGLTIGACLIIAIGLFSIKALQLLTAMEQAAAYPEPMETVEFVIATADTWIPFIEVIAETQATQSIKLKNELAGVIAEVRVRAGQTIKKGQLFLSLETIEEQAKLAAIQANLKLAQTHYQRMVSVVEKGAASESSKDQAEANRDSLLAEEAELEAIIKKKNIHSPFDAITGLHSLEVGQYLTPGELLNTLVGISDVLWVNFSLPQQLSKLNIGDLIQVSADGFYNGTREAYIIAKDSVADTSSRNVRFRAEIKNTDGLLISGMALLVEVPTGIGKSGQILPVTAIRYDSNGTYVYRLEPLEPETQRGTHRASKTYVVIGEERAQKVLVIDGIAEDDVIASVGSFKLREGILVNALSSSRHSNRDLNKRPK